MKRILFVVLVCILPVLVVAQTDTLIQRKKKAEVSFSLSLQNFGGSGGESSTSFLLAPRIGFFLYEGLQIEPEGVVLFSSTNPAYMLNGNLVYNFVGKGKAVPFLLLGYGIANTVPVFNIPMFTPNFAIGVLNVGLGLKAFLAENVAMRCEYRFQKFSGEGKTQSYYEYSYTQKVDARIHSFQVGIVIVP